MIVRDALPDKWCIKTYKNEEGKIIGNWFDKQSKNICYHEDCLGEYYHSYNCVNQSIMYAGDLPASFANYSIREGYTEITFEQFKKYVLKELITQNKLELTEFPNEGFCKTDSIELRNYLKNKFPQLIQKPWDNKYSIIAWNNTGYWWCAENSSKPEYQLSQLEKFFTKEIKQSLKQAVHCKTQEEWDFVTEKLGYKWSWYSKWSSYKNNTCINLNELGFGTADVAYKGYQILSFKEWCDLNGYKMENKPKFEVGKWYRINHPNYKKYEHIFKFLKCENERVYYSEHIRNGNYETKTDWHAYINDVELCTLEEIQQYLPDGHPDKLGFQEKASNQTEKDWTKASEEEELLKEAKRRYPIGTKFISPFSFKENTLKGEGNIVLENDFYFTNNRISSSGMYYIYEDGKWAEIISLPEENPYINLPKDSGDFKVDKSIGIENHWSQIRTYQLNEKLNKSNNSIFPTFEEKPLIQMKELQINKNYFQNFKDPYINK